MKNKPLMLAGLIFGGIGLAIIVTAIILYMAGKTDIYGSVAQFFGMTKEKINTPTICQLGILFEIAAFILGYRSLAVEK